ncbi:MAG: methyltransferase domain-containing protein [Alphaproteobacteria bacterium]
MNIRQSVQGRYAQGAQALETKLCCPVDYDPRYLEAIPPEVIERDYGCGDPSAYLREGECVLDLGSGGGKICFIASQVVGAGGRVIGVDMTPDMLDLARRSAPSVAERIGFGNVEFKRGHIEDLKTDLDLIDSYLKDHPVKSAEDYETLQRRIETFRAEQPLIAEQSIDVIVSNCVLNLVGDEQKQALFAEMFRVLKTGGRIAISDIVSDKPSPQHLKDDQDLWSGCISGAFTEAGFLRALEEAGFHGVTVDKYDDEPWQIVEGIEFRSVTVLAWKGSQGASSEKNRAVIYRGPWKQVEDDDGHVYARGQRVAVGENTFGILNSEPYAAQVIAAPVQSNPVQSNPVQSKGEVDARRSSTREPRETRAGKPGAGAGAGKNGCC